MTDLHALAARWRELAALAATDVRCSALGQCADELDAALREPPAPEPTAEQVERLLSSWAGIAKGLNLSERNPGIADYDDELASEIAETAKATLAWRAARSRP